ncbi:DUF2125 domain-containing protein [Nereida sp. MMG025]|uniref:DUF2125 domain-containing protein n=1 Tax=Nereida sp. MMG025 TaxID=2909981 RepID=UPI001F1917C8|nr:DUF2125 domain-containing protein [Nereida sp. MMG025]MCF6444769.1 DUF2125 domain-containing protein [Nereida sp. MMG025]
MRFMSASGLSLFLWATGLQTAAADISPSQVWDRTQAAIAQIGGIVSYNGSTPSDDLFELMQLQITLDQPDDNVQLVLEVPSLQMLSNGDGTVSLSVSDEIEVRFTETPLIGGQTEISGTITTSDLLITASGEPSVMRLDFAGSALELSLDELSAMDQSIPLDATWAFNSLAGLGLLSQETELTTRLEVSVADGNYSVRMPDPEVRLEAEFDGMTSVYDATGMDEAAVFGLQFGIDRGAVTYAITDEGDLISGAFGMRNMAFVDQVQDGIRKIEGNASDIDINLAGLWDQPIAGKIASYDMVVEMPAQSEGPFRFDMGLAGIVPSPSLQARINPNQSTDADGGKIQLSLAGQLAKATEVGFDLEALSTLDINGLLIELFGAQIEGQGNLSFTDAQAPSLYGSPQPVGSITLQATGVMALIDTLVAQDVLPSDTGQGAKMMIAFFAKPNEADGTLETQVTFTGDGQILLNGQRIR